jgi:hypothetical protein
MASACPLCGAPHSSCGQATSTVGIFIAPAIPRKETDMSLKDYEVEVNGVKTTLRLSGADAKARGLEAKKAPAPANKSRTASNKKG